jgi:hypothetical protein
MTHKQLEGFYDSHIGGGSTFCTDSHKSYIKFARNLGLEHKRIKSDKHKEGKYRRFESKSTNTSIVFREEDEIIH